MKNSEKPETGGKKSKKSYILMVLSVIAAIVLWFYVVDATNPTLNRTYSDIRVEILNQDSLADRGLAVVGDVEEFVNVKVSGKRSVILRLDASELVAAIDLSDCSEGENYVEVDVHTPGSVDLESVSKPQILVEVESIVTEDRSVEVVFEGSAEDDREAVCLRQELETVEVTGGKSVVSSVDHVEAAVDLSVLSEEADTYDVILTAVDEEGEWIENLTFEQESMEISAQLYVVKSVPLTVETTGTLPDGLELVSVETVDEISIALPENRSDRVTEITADRVDLSEVTESTTVELTLQLPDRVQLADGEDIPEAEITVKKADTADTTETSE